MLKPRTPRETPRSPTPIYRALFVAWDLVALFAVPPLPVLVYAIVTRQDMHRFLVGFVAGPVWVGLLLGSLFFIYGRRSYQRSVPGRGTGDVTRGSTVRGLTVALISGAIVGGLVLYALSQNHPSQSTPDVALSAGMSCGFFLGLTLGSALYALWLYRLERQTKCEIWTGVNNYRSSMGRPAFFMLDARRRQN